MIRYEPTSAAGSHAISCKLGSPNFLEHRHRKDLRLLQQIYQADTGGVLSHFNRAGTQTRRRHHRSGVNRVDAVCPPASQ